MSKEMEMSEEKDTEGKIRKHIRENRKFYIGAGVGLVIGVIGGVLLKKRPEVTQFVFKIRGDHNNPSMTYQTITNYGNIVGRPGTQIVDLTTGHKYNSIALGAKAMDVTYGMFYKSLNEGLDLNGHKFVRLIEDV